MKIVQSLWTKPLVHENKEIDNRFSGGWLNQKYNLMSWAFSCLQLCKYYRDVELITDPLGKYILIDRLGLPYSNVIVALDKLDHYDVSLWALGKLFAYSYQNEPFLHVDGDVYIWEKFAPALENAPLVAQNLEHNFLFYQTVLHEIEQHFRFVPASITSNRLKADTIDAYNAGIIGGNDLDFFRKYTAEAFKFVDDNISCLSHIPISLFNCFYEQHLFYCLAKENNVPVHCYTSITKERKLNQELKGVNNFRGAPLTKKYIHVFGEHKKKYSVCNILYNQLKRTYPIYLLRIKQFLKEYKNQSKIAII